MKFYPILLALCKLPRFIKNKELPACVDCIHYIDYELQDPYDRYDNRYSKCKNFGEKNIISGQIDNLYTKICRESKDLCGNSGKYFIKKNDTTNNN